MSLGSQTADISVNNRKGANLQHWSIWGPPFKNLKKSKIGLRRVLSWPKLDLEPKFHENETFGGFAENVHKVYPIFNGF